ncbi:SDR family NAD(P)-dependent oxidoreductase [Spirillospora sp. NPDC052242]
MRNSPNIANAGVQLISGITDLATADWDAQIDLNIKGVMNTIQAFVPSLESAAADGRSADLITTSSIAAVRILEGFQVYSATKAYVTQLVNCCAPSWAARRSAWRRSSRAWSTPSCPTTSPTRPRASSWPT